MKIDISFLPALAATFMLVFARIGIMVMLLPGLGEMTVPSRVRLTIALVLTAVIMPLHRNDYQIDMRAFGPVLMTLGQELLIRRLEGEAGRINGRFAQLDWTPRPAAREMSFGTASSSRKNPLAPIPAGSKTSNAPS